MLARRHDLTAVMVRDPAEQQLPPGGLVRLRDVETGGERLVDANTDTTMNRESLARFQRICRETDLDHLQIGPQVDCVEALSAYFHGRRRRTVDETGG